jgi:putative sigma-54 modulation protein
MKIEVRGRNVDLGTNLVRFTERALEQALSLHAPHVGYVRVRFVDLNGPRGGVDKRCLVQLEVIGHSNVVVDERSEDWYAAASEAARRCAEALERLVRRRRDRLLDGAGASRTDGDLLHA